MEEKKKDGTLSQTAPLKNIYKTVDVVMTLRKEHRDEIRSFLNSLVPLLHQTQNAELLHKNVKCCPLPLC